ncbi:hypothetical protein V6N13_073792 [Hibiscus sabdariffa]|uniref:Uncharacterized protein n=1 Tax=Hibiscus sabdariffa TaxID=183260 RepID=A0ABR2BXW1_9ROSI
MTLLPIGNETLEMENQIDSMVTEAECVLGGCEGTVEGKLQVETMMLMIQGKTFVLNGKLLELQGATGGIMLF